MKPLDLAKTVVLSVVGAAILLAVVIEEAPRVRAWLGRTAA